MHELVSKCVATLISCCEVGASSSRIVDWEVSQRGYQEMVHKMREFVMFPNQYWTFLLAAFHREEH